LKNHLIIFFALFLITLPACFKKEMKKDSPIEAQIVKNEKKPSVTIRRAFSDDTVPCYGWELEQENITNAD
jgi:hypothetical protein